MKASLEFSLPEEQDEFRIAVDGIQYKSVIEDYLTWLRSKLKYEDLPEIQYLALEDAREQLYNFLNERDLHV